MTGVYRTLKVNGSTDGIDVPLADFGELTKLMGFEDIWAFEKRYAEASRGNTGRANMNRARRDLFISATLALAPSASCYLRWRNPRIRTSQFASSCLYDRRRHRHQRARGG